MIRQTVCGLLVFLLFTPTAVAQSIIALKTETGEGVNASVVQILDQEISTAARNHPEIEMKGRQDVSVSDLAMGGGCSQPDEACLKGLKAVLGSERIVFAKVEKAESGHVFSAKVFDFGVGEFIAETSLTTDGDLSILLPAFAEGAIWGDVGVLAIEISGAEAADLTFDGDKMGVAPTTLKSLPLGEHTVTVETAAGEVKSRDVLLRAGNPQTISFDFGTTVVDDPIAEPSGPSVIPGIALLVVGVGAIGFGVAQTLSLNSDHKEIERIENEFGDPDCRCFPSIPAGERQTLLDLEDKRGSKTVLQFVGYGVGVGLAGVGTYLLVNAVSKRKTETSAEAGVEDAGLNVQIGPTPNGVAGTLMYRF